MNKENMVKDNTFVLVPGHDHSYIVTVVVDTKVVKNKSGRYEEYVGDEYLNDGDVVMILPVAI